MEHKESIGNMAHRLKSMLSQPASKEWFEKHGLPGKKHDMAKKMPDKSPNGKIILPKARRLTEAEKHEKTKDWPKGSGTGNNPSEKFKVDHQRRNGRAYSE